MTRVALLFALALAGDASAQPMAGGAVDAGGKPLRSSCALARLDAGDPGASVLDCVISDARTPRSAGPTDSAIVLLTRGPASAPAPALKVVAGAARSGQPAPTNLALRVLITDPPKVGPADTTEIWLTPPPATRRR